MTFGKCDVTVDKGYGRLETRQCAVRIAAGTLRVDAEA